MLDVGASAEVMHWLIDGGIKVMGTDGWGWDIPLDVQVKEYLAGWTKADAIFN